MLHLGSDFSGQDFLALRKLDSLYWVAISGRRISDDEFASLANVPNLSVLHLHNCTFSSSGIEQLSKSKSLQSLNVRGATLDDRDIKAVATLPIQSLTLESTHLDNCSLNTLKSIPFFLTLNLVDTDVPQDFDLKAFKSLERISLVRANLDNRFVQNLVQQDVATNNRLKHLDLTGNKLTDSSVDELKKMTSVVTLCVRDTKLNRNALNNLRTGMPKATVYSDNVDSERTGK